MQNLTWFVIHNRAGFLFNLGEFFEIQTFLIIDEAAGIRHSNNLGSFFCKVLAGEAAHVSEALNSNRDVSDVFSQVF